MPHKDKEIQSAYARKYHQEHKKEVHKRQHEYYLKNRERLLSAAKEYQKNHLEQMQKWNLYYTLKIKTEVLTHYGNGKLVCVKCGFSDLRAITLDHIAGGGNKLRQSEKMFGNKMYRWLIKNHLPVGYQTLCMNCQFIKRREAKEN